jgi:hypothetical protein
MTVYCLAVASDLTGTDEDTPVVVVRDHEDTEGILLLGVNGIEQTIFGSENITRDDWRVELRLDRLLFGPPGAANSSLFDSGVIRDQDGDLLLRGGGR